MLSNVTKLLSNKIPFVPSITDIESKILARFGDLIQIQIV